MCSSMGFGNGPTRLNNAIRFARGSNELGFTDDAKRMWHPIYETISKAKDDPILDAVSARAPAQIIRLALIYALLDESSCIDTQHIVAAVACWDYVQHSINFIFESDSHSSLESKIKEILTNSRVSTTQISRSLGGHVPAKEYKAALKRMEGAGQIRQIEGKQSNGGKTPIFYELAE